ncbi:MAG: hypothetical protein AAGA21_14105 [Pseudomonadota bacterium]
MRTKMFLCTLIISTGAAFAGAPQVPSSGPYIVLSQNLDEPNGYGFCLDTSGPGKSDLMHTHSCKPAKEGEPRSYRGNDTRFEYSSETMQIMSYPFEGFCMQALIARDVVIYALLECSNHPRQKFKYDLTDQTLRLNEDESLCVSVASETQPAGPWVKRALMLTGCNETEASLKEWTVVAN